MSDLFAVLDTAQDGRLHQLVRGCPDHVCLFAGKLDPALAQVAPYLVRLDAESPLADLWRSEGWGRNWGILCRSGQNLPDLRRHFRKFLQVMLPDGAIVLFRFYDPRVWRTYLPTCNASELADWFAGVEEFNVEAAEGAGTLRYSAANGVLSVSVAE